MLDSVTRFFASLLGDQAGGGKAFHSSRKCPECGSKLWAEAGTAEPVWSCPNPDCPAQVRARIAHWCSPGAMDLADGERLASELVRSGLVRDVAELYRLKRGHLSRLKPLDEKSAECFLVAIAASKKREWWRVLYGLGIQHVTAAAAQSLAAQFPTLLQVLDASLDRLMETEGVSEATARSIVHWYGDQVNRNMIKRLEKAGVNFKSESRSADGKPPAT